MKPWVLLFAVVMALVAAPFDVEQAVAAPPQPGDAGAPMPGVPTVGEISVVSGPSGVTIYIRISTAAPGRPGTPGEPGQPTGSSGPSCSASPVNVSSSSVGWVREGLAAHPDTLPWAVSCDNGYFGIAWVPVSAPGTPAVVVAPPVAAVDPVAIAAEVLGIVPLPPIKVGASPGVGLVAMPSWYWVDGYDGSTLRGSKALGLTTVEVEITPSGYHWEFGDGASVDTHTVGRPYPEPSDIQHAYQRSSFGAGGTYPVELAITFNARFRVDGGPWAPLSPVVQRYARDYPVQQLQSVLTPGR